MRTTLNIDDRLLKEAARLSGIAEKTAVVRAGLEALITGRAPDAWRRWAGASQAFGESADVDRSRAARVFMLVDTSVWVDHLRRSDPALSTLLSLEEVECHPFIIGELACGSLHRRSEVLSLLQRLPLVPVAATMRC